MPNIRIKDIPTTASATSSTDFIAIDGATNGTRKLSADSPVFSGNVTVNGGTVGTAASTNLTLAGGSSGASLALGQGADGSPTITPKGAGLLFVEKLSAANDANTTLTRWRAGADGALGPLGFSLVMRPSATGANRYAQLSLGDADSLRPLALDVRNLLIGGTTDITGSGGLKVFGTTESTSTTTGALQVAGGVGIGKNLWVGGTTIKLFDNTIISSSGGVGPLKIESTADAGSTIISTGFSSGYVSQVIVNARSNASPGIRFSTRNTERMVIADATGNASISSTTASTSTTTGALTVAGGVGVGGAAFFGGAIAIGNTVNTVTATLPNRTITIEIGGTTYYIHAKTTND